MGLERVAPPVDETEWSAFAGFVRTAFSQRRETLLNNFRPTVGRATAEAALAALDLPRNIRAEGLGLPEFVALFREMKHARRESY